MRPVRRKKSGMLAVTAMCGVLLVPASAVAEGGGGEDKDPLTLFGDFRFRTDVDTRSGTGVDEGADSRLRPRLRARIGAKYQTAVEGLSFGIRIATNPGTPGNSPHQTFDALSANVITLDRAFLKFVHAQGLFAVIGKQGYPHWQQTEILWDEDIQPEGFTGGVSRAAGPGKLGAQLGFFYITNNGWEDTFLRDESIATWQLHYKLDHASFAATAAVTGLHIFDQGPVTNTDGMFEFGDVSFFQGSVQAKTKTLPVTITVGLDAVMSDAEIGGQDEERNTAFVGQLRLANGDFGGRYYYYLVGEASVPFWADGTFSQDNFPNSRGGGLTGFAGHRIQFDWKVGKSVGFDARAYIQEGDADNVLAFSEVPDRSINRYQLNLNLKF